MTMEQIIKIARPLSVSATHCTPTGKITEDSRQAGKGDIFVAIRGNTFDGHKFIPQVISQGAAVVICEENYESDDACILVVPDTRKVLGPLALEAAGNPQRNLRLIGVTGTNGKTTVTTLIWQALTELKQMAALSGTVSKFIGTTAVSSRLTTPGAMELAGDLRQAADAGCKFFVMEVSSHALEQLRTEGLDFEIAVFTNLSHDHLDYHGSMESYASAKKRLFDSLPASSTAIVNADDPWSQTIISDTRAQVWDIGFRDGRCRIVESGPGGILLDLDGEYISSNLSGRFNAYNVAQAWLAVVALGFAPPTVARALAESNGAPGRLENITRQVLQAEGDSVQLPSVFVDYAHTPDALENVLQTVNELRGDDQPVITVFGCGGDRDRKKRPEMARIAEKYSTICVVTSDNPRFEDPDAIIDEVFTGFHDPAAARRISDRREAITETIRTAPSGSLILVAGKGHEDYQEIRGERHPLDDRAVARAALKARLHDGINSGGID